MEAGTAPRPSTAVAAARAVTTRVRATPGTAGENGYRTLAWTVTHTW
ncbi:MAG: hypothetical protein JO367_19040, partial [Actinobacteria bacterium]|nr:hypothetical protein [Actinomycetota bacterium]